MNPVRNRSPKATVRGQNEVNNMYTMPKIMNTTLINY